MELLNKIQQELKVKKGKFNKHGSFWYRSAEDILEAVKPLLGEAAVLTMNDKIVNIGDRFYVEAEVVLTSIDGKIIGKSLASAREVLDRKGMSPDQITGAASSYARKYALNGLFCIDDAQDADFGEDADLPQKPTEQEEKVLATICKQLEKDTGKKVIKNRVAAIYYTELDKYPSQPAAIKEAIEWLVALKRESEWTESTDMKKLNELLDQAYFEFETVNQPYLADQDGKMKFDNNAFIRAVTKEFGGLPENKTVQEIVKKIKPEDVAVKVEEQ